MVFQAGFEEVKDIARIIKLEGTSEEIWMIHVIPRLTILQLAFIVPTSTYIVCTRT
jgi:hypothetical protein